MKSKIGWAYRKDVGEGLFSRGKGHYEKVKILGQREDAMTGQQYLVEFSDGRIELTYTIFL